MSFPRAKITRFNENVQATPSPADYNVALKNNPTGAKISKTERFTEGKSPGTSDNGSVASAASTPCFRTPTLPKKKKGIFSSLSGRKPKAPVFEDQTAHLEALKDKIVECNNKDFFIRDLTEQIDEMKEKLGLMEQQKEDLNLEKSKCLGKINDLEEEHRIMLQSIYSEHDKEVKALREQLQKAENELKAAIEELNALKTNMRNSEDQLLHEIDKLKISHAESSETINTTLKEMRDIVSEKEKLYAELEERLLQVEKKQNEEIAVIKDTHKHEMTDLEFTMLESVSKMQTLVDNMKIDCKNKISELETKHETEKGNILVETNARIRQVEENSKEANLLAEIQMSEKCKDVEMTWTIKLEDQEKQADAILKECQAISEYNIIQCELEKNTLKAELAKKLNELEELQKEHADLSIAHRELEMTYDDLQDIMTETNIAMDEMKRKHYKKHEQYERELQTVLNQKKLYEISIQKSHETIETLKKRLLDSDHDVEQLKSELEVCELSKLEFQGKTNQLSEELEEMEDLEVQYESTVKKTEERIQSLEQELCKKVEEYNKAANKEIENLKSKLQAKEGELLEAMDHLKEQQTLNALAHNLIGSVQQKVDADSEANLQAVSELGKVKSEYSQSQHQLEETKQILSKAELEINALMGQLNWAISDNVTLREDLENYKVKNKEMDSISKQVVQLQEKADTYSQYCDYYKSKAIGCEAEIEELQGVNKKYIEQSGRYDDLLQKYEGLEEINANLQQKITEQESLIGPFREQLEAYEMEQNALLNQKSQAESEARDMGLKYAQLLGHQNQKQKIKHMIDLKSKNNELLECKKDMETKLRAQTRMIEKLKKELSSLTKSPRKSKLHTSDKENISSPNRTLNGSRVESPGPLRNRN